MRLVSKKDEIHTMKQQAYQRKQQIFLEESTFVIRENHTFKSLKGDETNVYYYHKDSSLSHPVFMTESGSTYIWKIVRPEFFEIKFDDIVKKDDYLFYRFRLPKDEVTREKRNTLSDVEFTNWTLNQLFPEDYEKRWRDLCFMLKNFLDKHPAANSKDKYSYTLSLKSPSKLTSDSIWNKTKEIQLPRTISKMFREKIGYMKSFGEKEALFFDLRVKEFAQENLSSHEILALTRRNTRFLNALNEYTFYA